MLHIWNHNIYYHHIVLENIPLNGNNALDAGCGDGLLTTKLAPYFKQVTGIDLDVADLNLADTNLNIRYIKGDFLTYPFKNEKFDFITAAAVLHHLPLTAGLERFKQLTTPGGKVAIIGLYKLSGLADFVFAALARPVSFILRLRYGYNETSAAMTRPVQTLAEIKHAAALIMPDAVVKRHLLFRFTLVWINK